MKTTVSQLINNNGNPAADQFILNDGKKTTFQSYRTIIAHQYNNGNVVLDTSALDYSRTTSKHLFIFLDMCRKEIESLIKSGSIKLRNLNK